VDVLQHQDDALRRAATPDGERVTDALLHIRDLGQRILAAVEAEEYDEWGRLLDEHWHNKKKMSSRISLGPVDELYEHVRSSFGVLGGKIVGAGGGGFLMLYAPARHRELEAFMQSRGMPRLHYKVENAGTKVIADHANGPPIRARDAPGISVS
jgi:D-glycero-alpha-D-manno-heptose-7-phosphate kinase